MTLLRTTTIITIVLVALGACDDMDLEENPFPPTPGAFDCRLLPNGVACSPKETQP